MLKNCPFSQQTDDKLNIQFMIYFNGKPTFAA